MLTCHDLDTSLTHITHTYRHWMSTNPLKLNAEKTELVWTVTKHNLSLLGGCGPRLHLGEDIVTASEHKLSPVKHVGNVCAAGFFQASTTTFPVITLLRIGCNTRPCFCGVQRGLL